MKFRRKKYVHDASLSTQYAGGRRWYDQQWVRIIAMILAFIVGFIICYL